MVITRSGLHPEDQVLSSNANTDLNLYMEAAARGGYTIAHRVTPSISFHHTLIDTYVFVGRYGTLLSCRFLFGSGSGDGSAMGSGQRGAADAVLFREIRRQRRVQREWERGTKIIGI